MSRSIRFARGSGFRLRPRGLGVPQMRARDFARALGNSSRRSSERKSGGANDPG
jgi:hypothetical protein